VRLSCQDLLKMFPPMIVDEVQYRKA
jgi:hypothetical protein